MVIRSFIAWLMILALALVLFSSCESGGYYRHTTYRFGGGVGFGHYYGRPSWGYYPGYDGRPPGIDLPDIDEPIAIPLPSIGMPDFGGGDIGGFDE